MLVKVTKGIPKFNEDGNLPFGIYKASFEEFENKFSKGLSQRRKEIMEYYKLHLNEIIKCEYTLNHWIDGSFVTKKENPGDIDTLTELDGPKCDVNNIKNKLKKTFDKIPDYTEKYCHSFYIFKYPKENDIEHELYLSVKASYLTIRFAKDKLGNPKGIVQLDLQGGEIE